MSMSNRFGSNSAIYDLSRLMTFALGAPAENVFSAPIILDNPAITSGIALFSHTPQPFSAAVPAGQELRLFDLNFANTGAATSQFYGIKIQSNSDVVDTGAAIALFNLGRADAMYIDVAGKSGNPAGNNPTGIGIDVNKSPTSSAERASANSRQIGIQIFDWSTTNQSVGGPAGMLLQKIGNLNTDHFLTTYKANRNHIQVVVVSGDAGYNTGMPVVRVDDETTAANWWSIVASGEQVFNKDGIGIQWITPGAKTAYILASTNDLKLKSGGTGIRFVNQADTQTIVMMQDDLSVDIINNETRFQAIKIVSDRIEQYTTNALGSISLNYNGYNGGTTQFRDTKIFDGKQNVVAIFTGTNKNLLLGTATDKATGTPHVFFSDGGSITRQSAAAMYFMSNAWNTGAGLKRLAASNGAALIEMFNTTPAINFYFQTDAGNTVDSSITLAQYYNFQKDLAQIGLVSSPGYVYLNSMIFGGMYADNISQSVTISATDTHYEVGGSISGGNTNHMTFQNSKELKILDAGTYLITYSISVQCANANQEIETSIMVNSTASARLSAHTNITTANQPRVLSGTNPISLTVNDVVKFCVANHTATNNIVVSHANMSIVRIGA